MFYFISLIVTIFKENRKFYKYIECTEKLFWSTDRMSLFCINMHWKRSGNSYAKSA